MVSVSRKGKITAEVEGVDVLLGQVEKNVEGDWETDCALCEQLYLHSTKGAAVDALEQHFVLAHTTAASI